MSKTAQSVLRIWASFDDPMTVLIGFLVLLPLISGIQGGETFKNYIIGLLINILPAILVIIIKKIQKNPLLRAIEAITNLCMLALAYFLQGFLLAALTGLILRPYDEKKLSKIVRILFFIVVLLIGVDIAYTGINLRLGLLLAIVAFFLVQPIFALVFTKGTITDLINLMFAQQNGLTTLLMGLGFEAQGYHVLNTLLPAIIIINLMHILINSLYSWKVEKKLINI